MVITGSVDFGSGSGYNPHNVQPNGPDNEGTQMNYVLLTLTAMHITVDADFDSGPYDITFIPGDRSVPFTVPLVNDNVYEGSETFTLTILPSESIKNRSDFESKVMIVDDDGEYLIVYIAT